MELQHQINKNVSIVEQSSLNNAEFVRAHLPFWMSKHGVLNGYEACRLLNGFGKRDFKGCFELRDRAHQGCNRQKRCCVISMQTVHNQLRLMQERGELDSEKIRWFDGGKTSHRKTDLFRFYFEDRAIFETKILSVTVNPYLMEAD